MENHEDKAAEQTQGPRTASSAHTPGPWQTGNNNPTCVFGGPLHEMIADCGVGVEDARLIATAPDMLAALQMVANDVRSGSFPTPIQNAISAAIAKATGAA